MLILQFVWQLVIVLLKCHVDQQAKCYCYVSNDKPLFFTPIKENKHTHLHFQYYTAETEESHNELILSLSKNLLRSLETPEGTPNPSVHLALRLSNSHNQAKELIHLNSLKNHLHNDIQRYIEHVLYISIVMFGLSWFNVFTLTN